MLMSYTMYVHMLVSMVPCGTMSYADMGYDFDIYVVIL